MAFFLAINPVAAGTVVGAGYKVMHDSNLFRLPRSFEVAMLTGREERSDLTQMAMLFASVDKPISRQQFLLDLSLTKNRFRDYPELDHAAYQAAGRWRWKGGRLFSGELAHRVQRSLTGFADFRPGKLVQNLQDMSESHFLAEMKLSPGWELLSGMAHSEWDNSKQERFASDKREDGLSAGVRFTSRAGNVWELKSRSTEGDYPNRLLSNSSDNQYAEQQIESTIAWVATEASSLQFRFGNRERDYKHIDGFNYSGMFGSAHYYYDSASKLRVSASARHDRRAYESFSAKFVDIDTAQLVSTWNLTNKLEVEGLLEYVKRDFAPEAGFDGREDRVRTAGLTLAYEPVRSVRMNFALRWEGRDSNKSGLSYSDRQASLGIEVRR